MLRYVEVSEMPIKVALENSKFLKPIYRPHSFTAEENSWGPYITSVQGIKANNNDRTYWELLSNGEPLSQGKRESAKKPHRVTMPQTPRCECVSFGAECAKAWGK